MIERESIVCFAGEDWWYHNPHSVRHIMQRFARKNRVLFVNSIGMRIPSRSDSAFLFRMTNKLRSILRWTRKVDDNLRTLSPISVPVYHRPWLGPLNRFCLLVQVRLAMALFGIRKPILWIVMPTASELVGYLSEKVAVFQCVDKFSAFDGVPPVLKEMEEELTRQANVVLYPGPRLLEERGAWNPNSHLIEHGVDYHHFRKALEDGECPPDLRDVPEPRIGYIGAVGDFIDEKLMAHLAGKEPGWQFVFVGAKLASLTSLCALPNVHFLGHKPYDDLPDYARQLQVLTFPWKTDHDYHMHRNPVKLKEYLATGRPIVSVDFPGVISMGELIHCAQDAREFHQQIKRALASDGDDDRKRRLALASQHTWEGKVEIISGLIERQFASRDQFVREI